MENKNVRSRWENRKQYDERNKTMNEDDLLEFYEWSVNNDLDDLIKNIYIDNDDEV